MPIGKETDAVTGTATTGHEWDGIKELDTPMPKWWVYTFLACIVWAAGYCLLYPSIPYGTGYWPGLLGYSSRTRVNAEVADVAAGRMGAMDQIARLPFAAIIADPKLSEIALTSGRITFANNCQACHAAGGAGRIGYPALAAGAWIWGGTLDDIHATVTNGIRNGTADARSSQMPRFGQDGLLDAAQIEHVTDFVWTKFYGHAAPALDVSAGAELFAANCAACHGEQGTGSHEMGAPRLASHVHLYGDAREAIRAQVQAPKSGVMPNWNTKLDPATIKSVVLYVHSLGGGE